MRRPSSRRPPSGSAPREPESKESFDMRLSHFAAVLAALAVPVALMAGSCGYVLDDFEKVPAAVVDAGPDAPEGCKSVTYPPPPDAGPEAPDAGGQITFTVGVRSIDLGET